MNIRFNLRERLRPAGWHLAASLAVAAVVATLVFGLWFPGAYRTMAGGRDLLVLIMAVDVVLGPVLTFTVYNTGKTRGHLRRDIATIAVLQLAALGYGLQTVYQARPVALVFEQDRFRVISAAEVLIEELPKAAPEFRRLSLSGPKLMAVRKAEAGAERSAALMAAALDGVDTSQRPTFWVPYGVHERGVATKAGRPLSRLIEQYPDAGPAINLLLADWGLTQTSAVFLPIRARGDAVAVLTPEGAIAGFLPYNGFF